MPTRAETRMESLAIAEQIRLKRAEVKREWKELGGRSACHEFAYRVITPEKWAQTWRVEAALKAIPGVGPQRIAMILRISGIEEGTRMMHLDKAQRAALRVWAIERRDGRDDLESLRAFVRARRG